ncbi:putative aspartic proteinase GIP2 [Apium graveolens]|uniref:putative aspartic proteinase GIP2 n=1 Tax=Apium graveolens TaxID=4045 RepID=UPI003D7B7D47
MASSTFINVFLICCLFFISSSSIAQSTTRSTTKGLILRVSKDPSTLQYTTEIKQRTPLVTVKLIVDLGGRYLWVNCDEGYTTSTYRAARCKSAQCSLAKSMDCMTVCYSHPAIATPACSNITCTLWPENTYVGITQMGTLGSDALSILSAAGGAPVSISQFLFVCGSTSLLGKLASGVTGSAGLGRTQVSMPTQLSSAFKLEKKFGM